MSFIIIWVTKPTYKTRYIATPLDIQSTHYIAILLHEQCLLQFDMLDENYGGLKSKEKNKVKNKENKSYLFIYLFCH